jgi:hypothetical protein
MGVVIWFRRQDDPTAADDDRLYLFREAEFLDALADGLGIRKLSTFFDHSDAYANVSEEDLGDNWVEEHEAWHDPSELLTTLEALHIRLTNGEDTPPEKAALREEILDEIQGCMAKARSAIVDNAKVHLCVVM